MTIVEPIPGPGRSLALLNRLLDSHGPQVFGQIMQRLLAQTFKGAGYSISLNAVGVPDFIATKGFPPVGFAIEVKTGSGSTLLFSSRDLEGIRATGLAPVIAVLCFPAIEPQWVLLDARYLEPGTYRAVRLTRQPRAAPAFDVNSEFRQTLSLFHAAALANPQALKRALAAAASS
jgi:hypothetical protein